MKPVSSLFGQLIILGQSFISTIDADEQAIYLNIQPSGQCRLSTAVYPFDMASLERAIFNTIFTDDLPITLPHKTTIGLQ